MPENLEVFSAKNLKMQIPTPLEFSLYVPTEAEKVGVENLNPHWQSQWGCCPFCTLDFDIIGHLETFKVLTNATPIEEMFSIMRFTDIKNF